MVKRSCLGDWSMTSSLIQQLIDVRGVNTSRYLEVFFFQFDIYIAKEGEKEVRPGISFRVCGSAYL